MEWTGEPIRPCPDEPSPETKEQRATRIADGRLVQGLISVLNEILAMPDPPEIFNAAKPYNSKSLNKIYAAAEWLTRAAKEWEQRCQAV